MLEFISVNQLAGIALILAVYYIYQERNYKRRQFVKNAREEYYKVLNSEEYKVKKNY